MSRFAWDPGSLSREEPITFEGPAGPVEALWRPARSGAPARGAVVTAHPHPAFGGTMMNKVVFHVARTLNHHLDLASLRFNFRGVGRSAGTYDAGRGEVDDLLAAWAEAGRRVPGLPLVAAGFSFGAGMTLLAAARRAANRETLPQALALVGVPLRIVDPPAPFPAAVPVAAVHGERDRYTPPEAVGAYLESWPAPSAFLVIPGADHFLEGRLPEASEFLSRNVKEWL